MKLIIFTIMNYPIDLYLDAMLNACLNSGIKNVKSTQTYLDIEFNNGSKAYLWNGNKYYAWLNRGYIDDYKYENSRPKKSTMRRLRKAIIDYYFIINYLY